MPVMRLARVGEQVGSAAGAINAVPARPACPDWACVPGIHHPQRLGVLLVGGDEEDIWLVTILSFSLRPGPERTPKKAAELIMVMKTAMTKDRV